MSATSQKPETEPELVEAAGDRNPGTGLALWIGWQAGGGVRQLFAGAPFIALASLPGVILGWDIGFTAFLLTVCAAFTVHIPVLAIASGATGEETADIELSPRLYGWLLLLWAGTDWGLAILWR
jgi:hypothetical protein